MRTKNTVLELYRPVKWCEEHITWDEKESGIPWNNSGGDWYDKMEFYRKMLLAVLTINANQLPDNKYYEFDVT